MKLDIVAMAREADLRGDPEDLEAFARLIVERCARVCESKYQSRSDGGFPREASTAKALRDEIRNLLED